MEFGVSFVQAAAQYGTETVLLTHRADVEGLGAFIRKAEVKDMNDANLLNIAFLGKSANTDEELRIIFDQEIKRLGI